MTLRIIEIRESTIPLSRYAEPAAPGGLTTSLVSVHTNVGRHGTPIVGYGYASVGRYAQGGLIRERFAPRLMAAPPESLSSDGITFSPAACWSAMMAGEKPGGHGERCVAVGALDMAIWDAAAKIADLPLHTLLSASVGREQVASAQVPVYASGGYRYPERDLQRLSEELQKAADLGFTTFKIKIGGADLSTDLKRVETAQQAFQNGSVAVDAMNLYTANDAATVAAAMTEAGVRWLEDPCDPLDFETQTKFATSSGCPIAAGEALFSLAEAKLLHAHGGLDPSRDLLVFDPAHCYGLTHFLQIVDWLVANGWNRSTFWPHGGSVFCQHIVAALGLGGAEITPFAFEPFRGCAPDQRLENGFISLPTAAGIGFETHPEIRETFRVRGH